MFIVTIISLVLPIISGVILIQGDRFSDGVLGNDRKTIGKIIDINDGTIWNIVMKFAPEMDKDPSYATARFWNDLRGSKCKETDCTKMNQWA
jgi:hypothetical protein